MYVGGLLEVKMDPFFKGIDWDTFLHQSTDDAFVPKPNDTTDTSYFLGQCFNQQSYAADRSTHFNSLGSDPMANEAEKGSLDSSLDPTQDVDFENFSFKNIDSLR